MKDLSHKFSNPPNMVLDAFSARLRKIKWFQLVEKHIKFIRSGKGVGCLKSSMEFQGEVYSCCVLSHKPDLKGGEEVLKVAQVSLSELKGQSLKQRLESHRDQVVCHLYRCFKNMSCRICGRCIGTIQCSRRQSSSRALDHLRYAEECWSDRK